MENDVIKKINECLKTFNSREMCNSWNYNNCHNFYDITIYDKDLPTLIDFISEHNLGYYVTYHGSWTHSNTHKYSMQHSIYGKNSYITHRFWVHPESLEGKPHTRVINDKEIENLHNIYNNRIDALNRCGYYLHDAIWRFMKEDDYDIDDIIEDGDVYNCYNRKPSRVGCLVQSKIITIDGKSTYMFYGYKSKDLLLLNTKVLDRWCPNIKLSKMYKGCSHFNDQTTSYYVFLNNGDFTEDDFAKYISENFKKNNKKVDKPTTIDEERKKIKAQIKKLQKKLKELG